MRDLLGSCGVVDLARTRKYGGGRPIVNFCTVQTECGVTVARKEHPCSLFPLFIAF